MLTMTIVFCTVRVISCALRLSWVYNLQVIPLAIAAQIFVAAGTVILFIINLFFVQRLMRARHPQIGWHGPFSIIIPYATVAITVLSLIMVITCVVQQFYTTNPRTHSIDGAVLLYSLTWFAVVAFLPIPIVVIMGCLKRRTYIDKFGAGRFRTKVILLLVSSTLLALGAAFRAAIQYLPPTRLAALHAGAPLPWYLSKAAFYCFDFGVELLVVLLYVLVRVDKRFYVPDSVAGPGEYAGEFVHEKPPPDGPGEIYAARADGRSMSIATQTVSMLTYPSATTYVEATDRRQGHSYSQTADPEMILKPSAEIREEDSSYLEYDARRKRYEIRRPESTVSLSSNSEAASGIVPIPGAPIDGNAMMRGLSTRSAASHASSSAHL